MRFLNFTVQFFLLLAVSLVTLTGCKPQKKVIKSPPHYNFGEVQTHKLDLKLKEISGIVWDREVDEFLTHIDEKGILFVLDKETKAIKKEYRFGDKADYEDIAIYNNEPYILRSDGQVFKIVRNDSAAVLVEAGKLDISGKNDFETMYADTTRKALIVICKNCDLDSKQTVSAFAFYPDSLHFDSTPVFKIDAEAVKTMSPHKTSKFQPSAASIHPVLKKLFIVSSASSQLVITDLNGKVESVFELGVKMFPQPEGLTFKSSGDMYISNEAATNPKATILRFVYRP